jgi:hypothetical protein
MIDKLTNKNIPNKKGLLSRRDFLRNSALASLFPLFKGNIDNSPSNSLDSQSINPQLSSSQQDSFQVNSQLNKVDKELTPSIPNVELGRETLSIDLVSYLVEIEEDGEKLYLLDYQALHQKFPDVVKKFSQERDSFCGYVFENNKDNPITLDFSSIAEQGKKIRFQSTIVRDAAMQNIATSQYEKATQSPTEAPSFGTVTAGLVLVGNFNILGGKENSGKHCVFTGANQNNNFSDIYRGIYARSHENSLSSNKVTIQNIKVEGLKYRKQNGDGNYNVAPAGISGDNINLEINNCVVDALLSNDPEVAGLFFALSSIEDNTHLTKEEKENLTINIRDSLSRMVDPHSIHAELIRGILLNNTQRSQKISLLIKDSIVYTTWDGITTTGLCDIQVLGNQASQNPTRTQIIQDDFMRTQGGSGAGISSTHNCGGTIEVRNVDIFCGKGIWCLDENDTYTEGQPSKLIIENANLRTEQWSCVARCDTSTKGLSIVLQPDSAEKLEYDPNTNLVNLNDFSTGYFQTETLKLTNTGVIYFSAQEAPKPSIKNEVFVLSSFMLTQQKDSSGNVKDYHKSIDFGQGFAVQKTLSENPDKPNFIIILSKTIEQALHEAMKNKFEKRYYAALVYDYPMHRVGITITELANEGIQGSNEVVWLSKI